MLLQGIFPPITTPFYPDGKIYFKKLEHNVERYSRTPVAGLTVLGSTGESIMLSDEEQGADRRKWCGVGHRDLAAD
jgi:4-hydroxy-2-oxoglutarate aldolase